MIIGSIFFLAFLLLFPSAAIQGSKYGVTLWLTELLPTLLPFFIAIQLFQQSLPQIAARRGTLFLGLLCGYPTGATLVSYQYKLGLLSKDKVYFYLGFVNNPSPMFILSFCGNYILHLSYIESLFLLFIIFLSSFLGSFLFYVIYKKTKKESTLPVPMTPPLEPLQQNTSQCIDHCILQSFLLITKVGGYVILFSIIGQIFSKVLSTHTFSGIFTLGVLEITSGISYLKQATFSYITKEILTVILLSFGGLSAVAQTNSVLSSSGIPLMPYVLNKCVNAILAGGIITILLSLL